jgi:hypothetical protein
MKLSSKRKRQLLAEVIRIYERMMVELSTGNIIRARDKFLTRVYEANLTDDKEELFWLGSLSECFFRACAPVQESPIK